MQLIPDWEFAGVVQLENEGSKELKFSEKNIQGQPRCWNKLCAGAAGHPGWRERSLRSRWLPRSRPWGTAAKTGRLPAGLSRPRPTDRESPRRATPDDSRRPAAFPIGAAGLKRNTNTCPQPVRSLPSGSEAAGRCPLSARQPCARKGGAFRGRSSLPGSTRRRGRGRARAPDRGLPTSAGSRRRAAPAAPSSRPARAARGGADVRAAEGGGGGGRGGGGGGGREPGKRGGGWAGGGEERDLRSAAPPPGAGGPESDRVTAGAGGAAASDPPPGGAQPRPGPAPFPPRAASPPQPPPPRERSAAHPAPAAEPGSRVGVGRPVRAAPGPRGGHCSRSPGGAAPPPSELGCPDMKAPGPRASEGGEPGRSRRCCRRHRRGPELGLVPEAGRPGRPEGLHCHGAGEGEGRRRGPLPAGAGPSGLIPDAAVRPPGPGVAGPRRGLALPPSRKGPARPPSGAADGGRRPRSRPGTRRARPVAGRRRRVPLPAGDCGAGGKALRPGNGKPPPPGARPGLAARPRRGPELG
ncbi:hypothetical protein EI555_012883 [Monodon monoceros]|uniref:Uncharacterized protein n=1 Tax=Monodon monoceros TaxID=40151 RepID=A0A4U1F9V9_MONMO|nr:hypothetical protein EI555_012883 [Monodon monoceros]